MSDEIDLKVEYTNRMAQENEALRAQVEVLHKAIYRQQRKEGWHEEHPLVTLCIATPAQCLAEVRAQAGRDGFVAGSLAMGAHGMAAIVEQEAEEYANQLRQQEQK